MDSYVACGYCFLHGRRGEEVAHEYGYMIVPHGVYRRRVAACVGVVDNIVVDERCVVEQLHGSCGGERTLSSTAPKILAHIMSNSGRSCLPLVRSSDITMPLIIGLELSNRFCYARIKPV